MKRKDPYFVKEYFGWITDGDPRIFHGLYEGGIHHQHPKLISLFIDRDNATKERDRLNTLHKLKIDQA